MCDLCLVPYHGYGDLVNAAPLQAWLQEECGQSPDDGIYLIAMQSEDGTLVVGDSNHPHVSPDRFASEAGDRRIQQHLRETIEMAECEVLVRWTGVYSSALPLSTRSPVSSKAVAGTTLVTALASRTGVSMRFMSMLPGVTMWGSERCTSALVFS